MAEIERISRVYLVRIFQLESDSGCCSYTIWFQKAPLSTDNYLKGSMNYCKSHINHKYFKTHTYRALAPG